MNALAVGKEPIIVLAGFVGMVVAQRRLGGPLGPAGQSDGVDSRWLAVVACRR
jgi:hypothetical protein